MIEQIKTVERLAEYVPHLVQVFRKKRKIFDEDLTEEEFISRLFSYFRDKSNLYFGRLIKDKLEFFVCCFSIPDRTKVVKLVWFVYVDAKRHQYTYDWIDLCKEYCKVHGIDELRFETFRLTRSYRRFTKKIGAKPMSIIYNINLKEN